MMSYIMLHLYVYLEYIDYMNILPISLYISDIKINLLNHFPSLNFDPYRSELQTVRTSIYSQNNYIYDTKK